MWYLQIDTLRLILAFALVYVLAWGAVRRFRPAAKPTRWLILFDLALLAYVSKRLAAFYAVYTVLSWLFVEVIRRAERGRRPLFVLLCIADIVPFLYVRAANFLPALPVFLTLIGFAYNMLKAMDALFFVYYTKRKIPLLTYANFILFFPVITAGPIFRYRDFVRFYDKPVFPDGDTAVECGKRFIRGMFKKMVVVYWMQKALSVCLARGQHFYVSIALALVSYALLYFDLSGYSDMAIATGTFMGIPTPENFKNPLSAASFTQFWRKWHVTLSDWIREHIFVVVNGKRLSKYTSALIGIITMMVMSLWHEFSAAALIDGVYMGAFLAFENIFSLTTVDWRRTKKWICLLRCAVVTLFFGINAMYFMMEPAQLTQALWGFFKL